MPHIFGIEIDPSWPDVILDTITWLKSESVDFFFKGLKKLLYLYINRQTDDILVICIKILSKVAILLPSFIKKTPEGYLMNETKINKSTRERRHPLSMRRSLDGEGKAIGKQARSIPILETGHSITPAVSSENEKLEELVKLDILNPVEKTITTDIDPNKNGVDKNAGWIPAIKWIGDNYELKKLNIDPDEPVILDDKRVSLDLLDPINHQESLQIEETLGDSCNTPQDIETLDSSSGLVFPDHPGLEAVYSGEPGIKCALGDGNIDLDDARGIRCKNCNSIFHETCACIIIEQENAYCPICNHSWSWDP